MNSVKRFISITAVRVVFILVVALVFAGMGTVVAGDKVAEVLKVLITNTPSEPVPVVPQGTTNVSGSLDVNNWPTDTDPLPVAQQGSVEVSGAVGIDAARNTVKIDSTTPVSVAAQGTTNVAGSVDVNNWPTDTDPLPVAQQGPVEVSGAVGIDSAANTVKIDSTTPVSVAAQGTTNVAGSVSISNAASNPVPVAPQGTTNVAGSVSVSNSTSSPVPVAQVGAISVSGTVGLSTSGNTVKLDANNNTVKVTNPSGQALDVRVVDGGGGGSAPQPVQFTSFYADSYTWTNAYTVPAGKVLKIENVSVYAESPTLFPVVSMRTTVGGVTSEHWLPGLEAEYMPQMATGTKIFSGSNSWRLCTQVAIYADQNTVVQSVARCNNGGPAGCGSPAGFNVTFSGYLTDK